MVKLLLSLLSIARAGAQLLMRDDVAQALLHMEMKRPSRDSRRNKKKINRVPQLIVSLGPRAGPHPDPRISVNRICKRLLLIYVFFYKRIMEINTENNHQ